MATVLTHAARGNRSILIDVGRLLRLAAGMHNYRDVRAADCQRAQRLRRLGFSGIMQ